MKSKVKKIEDALWQQFSLFGQSNVQMWKDMTAESFTAFRESGYEVLINKLPFLREASYVNVQGLQAIQHHELIGPIGKVPEKTFLKIKDTIRFALDL